MTTLRYFEVIFDSFNVDKTSSTAIDAEDKLLQNLISGHLILNINSFCCMRQVSTN
jgi:hypothetical protein